MKTLNTIVADLEYCKELKELGLVQKSIFVWVKDVDGYFPNYMKGEEIPFRNGKEPFLECSAWTASEILGAIPKRCPKHGGLLSIIPNFCNGFFIGYGEHQNLAGCCVEDGDNLANAACKELICLLKNNIISLEEVNKNI